MTSRTEGIGMRAALERSLNRIWYQEQAPNLLLRAISRLHLALLGRRWQRPNQRPPVPVIVVGNLNVGGGGKTPVVVALAEHFHRKGRRVAVISRGYGGRRRGQPVLVGPDSSPGSCGDEPVLIAQSVPVPVWICADRAASLSAAVDQGAELVIADDGLQHRALARSFEICVIDAQRGLGNGRLLPAGPLRQPAGRLEQVDVVLGKGRLEGLASLSYRLQPEQLARLDGSDPLPARAWAGREVDAVCGIANPDSFFATLAELGMRVRRHPKPDHHRFEARDFLDLAGPVVVTAKDAVKLARLDLEPEIRVLVARAELPAELLVGVEQHIEEFQ
jgi:tetraacyldisaccharide 4'-kinase